MTPYLFIVICFLCHELAQRKQETAGFTLILSQQISVCYSLQSPTLFKNAFHALYFSVHHFNLPVTQSTRVCFTVKMQHYYWQDSSRPSSQDYYYYYWLYLKESNVELFSERFCGVLGHAHFLEISHQVFLSALYNFSNSPPTSFDIFAGIKCTKCIFQNGLDWFHFVSVLFQWGLQIPGLCFYYILHNWV